MNKINYHKAYLIKFKRFENLGILKAKIFPQFHSILDKEDYKHLAIEEDKNGQDVMVLFVEESKAQSFIRICNIKELLVAIPRDITNDLIYSNIKEEIILKMMDSEEFKPVFERFYRENLTMDIILDKIIENGIDALTEIDKEILEQC